MAVRTPLALASGVVSEVGGGDVLAPLAWTYVNASAALAANAQYAADSTGGAITLTLPAVAGLTVGSSVSVSDVGQAAGSKPVTIAPFGADTINGANSSVSIPYNAGELVFFITPSGWKTLSFFNGSLPGGWNTTHLTVGSFHVWDDGVGNLRFKSAAPTGATDGQTFTGN